MKVQAVFNNLRKTNALGLQLNEKINILCNQTRLKEAIHLLPNESPLDAFTYQNLLKRCIKLKALEEGKKVHAHMIQTRFQHDVFLGNCLLDFYAKCGRMEIAWQLFDKMCLRDSCSWNTLIGGYAKAGNIEFARKVFDEIPRHDRDTVSWTAMIAAYAQNGRGRKAIHLFNRMGWEGVEADEVTYASVVSVCTSLLALREGKAIHGILVRVGFEWDLFISNAILDMYVKCGVVEDAHRMFDKMPVRDVVSWNGIIAGYTRCGYGELALKFFKEMLKSGMQPTAFTFSSLLNACAGMTLLKEGKQIHNYIVKSDLGTNVTVGNVLIDMYAKCARLECAIKVFDRMVERDVVTWNSLIAGSAWDDGLKVFVKMREEGIKCTQCTLASVFSACASLAMLDLSKQIHGYSVHIGLVSNVFAGSALVDTYAKCGTIDDARKVFDGIVDTNAVSWTTMIVGYAQNGCGKEALKMFQEMLYVGMKPDHITFVGVLSACSHAGLVEEGRFYFDSMMRDHGIAQRADHYTCMIDLLGRAGLLEEVEDLIDNMPFEPDAFMWASVLGACRIHGNENLAKRAADCHFKLEPGNAAPYVILSNIYASNGKWDNVAQVRKMMTGKLVKKKPGCSWLEMRNQVHSFIADDRSHPQIGEIHALLEDLSARMKKEGYIPDTSFVLLDVDEMQKQNLLLHHSEKLALAFGLLHASPGAAIRIVKNLRVCGDCHTAMKLISKIAGREIIVRDATRFHCFKGGFCSCKDYW